MTTTTEQLETAEASLQEAQTRAYLTATLQQLHTLESQLDMVGKLVDMSDISKFGDEGTLTTNLGGIPDASTAFTRALAYPGATAVSYTNETELRQIRARSRVLAVYNPFCVGAQRNRIAYTVGAGHTYKVLPAVKDSADEQTLDDCRAVIQEFCRRNRWDKRQKETIRRLDRDGERFLRLFPNRQTGRLSVRFVEPLLIQTPPGEANSKNIWFGIRYKDGDSETPVEYFITEVDAQGAATGVKEAVPAAEMQHLTANVDLTSPRGLPTWHALQNRVEAAVKTLVATGKIVEFRARIGMIRKHIGATAAGVQRVVDAMQTQATGGAVRTASQYPYAAIVDTTGNTEYQFPGDTAPVDKNVAAIQAELRSVAAALAMPEYMLSGDASNANYASTMVAEGPAVKTFEEMQDDLISADTEVMERALVIAAGAGLIEGAKAENILELVKVEAEPPLIKSSDRMKEAQADEILVRNRAMSIETLSARHGLNPTDERDKLETEADRGAGYGIEPTDPTEPVVPTDPAAPVDPASPTTGDVQQTALNGAQISSMVEVLQSVADGSLSKASATLVLQLAFPATAPEKITAMVNAVEVKDKPAEPVNQNPFQPKPQQPGSSSGQ